MNNETIIGGEPAIRDSEEVFLASFKQNIAAIEAWLAEMEVMLLKPNPDGRVLRLKNYDILPVFDEASKQSIQVQGSPEAAQYRGLAPRLLDYIFKSDLAIKKWESAHGSAISLADEVDTNEIQPHDEPMNAPTREEIDAKLELIETRMDGRVASIEGSVRAAITESQETRREIKSLKWTMVFTAVATVVGLWSVNAAIFSNMVASFESGKSTATAQADVKRQTEETAALIKRMQEDLDARKAPSPPATTKP
nr:hypothetical protein [uncultured Duganella sp.]